MADSTYALIKHNLNVDDIAVFKSQLETALSITISQLVFERLELSEYDQISQSGSGGWKLEICDYPQNINIWLFENIENGREMSFGREYVCCQYFGLDYLSQWFMLEECIKNPEYCQALEKERMLLYDISKRFGSSECVLLNGSLLGGVVEDIMDGVSLHDAVNKQKINKPQTEVLNKKSFAEKKIIFDKVGYDFDILSYSAILKNEQLINSDNWYYTILIDDFMDLR